MKRILLSGILILAATPAVAQSVPVLSITFEGNHNLDSQRLKSQLRLSREGGWYHSQTLQLELRNLEGFCRDEGYLRCEIGPPSVEMQSVPGRGQAAVIRVQIKEGPLYSLGELSVSGAEQFKPATLLHMAPLRTGQPFSRRKLAEWQKVVVNAYLTMGFMRFESRVAEKIDESRKVVDCVLECVEGAAYRVGRIAITGDSSINSAEVRKLLLLGEGSLYNPENLALSLHFLNGTRKYRPVSEADVRIEVDEAAHVVHFTFQLVPLKKSSSGS